MSSDRWNYANGALYALCDERLRQYFYEDGSVKTLEPVYEGRLHGEVLLYWPGGRLKRQSFFTHGLRDGVDRIWDEQGQLRDEGNYERGRPCGVHRRWNADGSLAEETTYGV